eukprot:m.77230 g.77230  ORF g.77230 m.77230 type:complete len:246 (+) comp14686_c0_seq2:179-916(+)
MARRRNVLVGVGVLCLFLFVLHRGGDGPAPQATIPVNNLRSFETTAEPAAGAAEAEVKHAEVQHVEQVRDPKVVPDVFRVRFSTTKGDLVFELTKALAPLGVAQVYRMVLEKFFDEGIAFFRCVPNFVVQFGIHGDPMQSAIWRANRIDDDPVKTSNKKGTLTFASAGKNTRTTQLFINLVDNVGLDNSGFSPLGKCVEGCDEVLENLNFDYGEKPSQGSIQTKGNEYLRSTFPHLDYITKAVIE